MPTMTDRRTVAANTRTANILAGLPFEFVVQPSLVRIYLSGSVSDIFADILIGGESIVSDSEMGATNRFPLRNEDLFAEHGGLPGERIFVALRNNTGGVVTVRTLVDVLPI